MKLPLFLALAALLVAQVLRAEPRVFTNTDGRTVKAELVALEDKTAVLRLANRKIAKVPLDTLSEADQSFIRKWWEENKDKLDAMNFVLKIDQTTEPVDRKTTRSGGGNNSSPETRRTRIDDYHYTCELNNYLPRDIEDIEIEYTIYKRVSIHDKDGSKTEIEEIDGSETIRHLKALGAEKFETEVVTCKDDSKTGGRGPRTWQRETILGVVFTLSKGGKQFLQQSDPEALLKRLEEEEKR